jgi:hypothetical protein
LVRGSVERFCRLTISLHGQTVLFWLFWLRHQVEVADGHSCGCSSGFSAEH